MARTKREVKAPDRERLLADWLGQLETLIGQINIWATELDWSTRRIEKKMTDSEIGDYKAPALLMQKETARVLLEPIARDTPGGEGLVDLYLLPAYDDIASLFYYGEGWHVHYPFPGSPMAGDIREAEGRPLSEATLRVVLEELVTNAA